MTPGTIARRGCGLSSYRSCPRPAATPNPGHPENIHQKPPQEHNDLAAQPADRGFRKAASVSSALSRSSVDMLSWQNLNHIWAMKGIIALQPLQIKEKRNGRWETNPVSTIVKYHNMKGCWPESWCLALQRGVDLPDGQEEYKGAGAKSWVRSPLPGLVNGLANPETPQEDFVQNFASKKQGGGNC